VFLRRLVFGRGHTLASLTSAGGALGWEQPDSIPSSAAEFGDLPQRPREPFAGLSHIPGRVRGRNVRVFIVDMPLENFRELLTGIDFLEEAPVYDRFCRSGLARIGTFLGKLSREFHGDRRCRFFECNADLRRNIKCDGCVGTSIACRSVRTLLGEFGESSERALKCLVLIS
jgi:hypothetical protein